MASNVETHRAAHEAFNRDDLDQALSRFAASATLTDHARGLVLPATNRSEGGWPNGNGDSPTPR
jgi:hypothetical protein